MSNLGFEVAKEEGLDVHRDATLLQSILAQLPQDKNWDTNIPREKALLEAKEMRYFYQKKNLRVSGSVSKETDKIEGGGDFKKISADKFLKNEPDSAQNVVKIENPALLKFKQSLTVLRSGKSKVERELAKTKDLLLNFEEKNPTLAAEVQKSMDVLETFVETLRTSIFKFEKVTDPTDPDTKSLDDLIEKCESHLDAYKRLLHKKKAALEN